MWVIHSDLPRSHFPTSSPTLNIALQSSSRLKVFLSWFAVFALCLFGPVGLLSLHCAYSAQYRQAQCISVQALSASRAGDFGNVGTAVMPK